MENSTFFFRRLLKVFIVNEIHSKLCAHACRQRLVGITTDGESGSRIGRSELEVIEELLLLSSCPINLTSFEWSQEV